MHGEQVRLLEGMRIDALMALDVGEGGKPVAVAGRLLEIEPVGGLAHRRLHGGAHRLAAAGEEVLGLLHERLVAIKADLAGAGRRAALDLVEQAGPRAAVEDGIRARAQEEGALERVDRAADRTGRGEGAEIVALARARAAMLGDLRRLVVAGDEDVGERLVVPEQHVVARPQALDQIGFEQQRLGLGARRDELHRRRRHDDALDAPGEAADARVALHPLLEAARLADVEHRALGVDHAIDAGPVGQPLDGVGDHLRPDAAAACLRPDPNPWSLRRSWNPRSVCVSGEVLAAVERDHLAGDRARLDNIADGAAEFRQVGRAGRAASPSTRRR